MNLLKILPGNSDPEMGSSTTGHAFDSPPPPLRRSILYGLLACVAVSMVLAVIPHAVTFFEYRSPAYLANGDDQYYLAIARLPYFGEWSLRDPFSPTSSHDPTLHAWVMFVPFAKATAALRLSVTMIPLVMRVIGSVGLGVSLFFLFYQLLSSSPRSVYWTILCTLVCLADAGFITGRSLLANFLLLKQWHYGTMPVEGQWLAQYRIVTPLLNLPALLALTACLLTPIRSRKYLAGAAMFLALCIYQYFFFWTAAVAAASADVVFSWLAKAGNRLSWIQARPGPVMIVLIVGIAAGAPELIHKTSQLSTLRHRDTLERVQPGLHLLPGDPVRTQNVLNVWVWLKIACGVAAVFVLRQRKLYFPTLLVIAGYLLANSAILTGIDSENWHYNYVFSSLGEIVLLSTVCLWLERAPVAAKVRRLAPIAAALILLSGLWVRMLEPLACAQSRGYTQALAATAPFDNLLLRYGTDCMIAGTSLEANTLLLRSRCAMLFSQYTGELSFISLLEVDQRHSLNGWIAGLTQEDYEASVRQSKYSPDTYGHPELQETAMVSRRMALFRALAHDYREMIQLYRPTHLLLAVGRQPNPLLKWNLIASANGLNLYELNREAAPAGAY
jgi:hypothetical protein